MARHTINFIIKNSAENVKKEYTSSFITYMKLNQEIIRKLSGKTHEKWHMTIGEKERIPYSTSDDNDAYIDLIFKSEEFINDGWCYINLGEETLSEKDKENDVLFNQWLKNTIDNVQIYFRSDLRLNRSFSGIDFDIEEESDSQLFFWVVKRIFEVLSNDVYALKVSQTSGNTDLHCIFPDRRAISWIQLIKAELLAEDLPSAYAVWYMPNIGSVVISTQEVFDNDNKKHKDTAHAIEQELHKIGLLPLIKGGENHFISRQDWCKNKGLPA